MRFSFTEIFGGFADQLLRSEVGLAAELNPTSLAMRTARYSCPVIAFDRMWWLIGPRFESIGPFLNRRSRTSWELRRRDSCLPAEDS
jgi:hypothetical protein